MGNPFNIFAEGAPVETRPRYEVSPGEGNLQMQAYLAAVVGPQRLAMAAKRTFNLEANETQRIINLSPASRHCSFVGVFLPLSAAGPAPVTLGMENMQGDSAGIPVELHPLLAPQAGKSFTQVMIPGESLYIQSAIDLTIIVAEVYF